MFVCFVVYFVFFVGFFFFFFFLLLPSVCFCCCLVVTFRVLALSIFSLLFYSSRQQQVPPSVSRCSVCSRLISSPNIAHRCVFKSNDASSTLTFRSLIEQKSVNYLHVKQPSSWQFGAIEALSTGRDVVVITPTGSGKSLPGQVLPLLWPGSVAVHICPLLAVAIDQSSRMNATVPGTCQMLNAPSPELEDEVKRGVYPIGDEIVFYCYFFFL